MVGVAAELGRDAVLDRHRPAARIGTVVVADAVHGAHDPRSYVARASDRDLRFRRWPRDRCATGRATRRACRCGSSIPASTDEVAAIVAGAHREQQRVKVIGAGHSFTPAAMTSGVLLSLDRMRSVRHVDAERGRVTVDAGITLAGARRRARRGRVGDAEPRRHQRAIGGRCDQHGDARHRAGVGQPRHDRGRHRARRRDRPGGALRRARRPRAAARRPRRRRSVGRGHGVDAPVRAGVQPARPRDDRATRRRPGRHRRASRGAPTTPSSTGCPAAVAARSSATSAPTSRRARSRGSPTCATSTSPRTSRSGWRAASGAGSRRWHRRSPRSSRRRCRSAI